MSYICIISDDSDSACDVCGQLFSTDVYMMKHRKCKHPLTDIGNNGRRGLYKCQLCLFSDDDVGSFQRHLSLHRHSQGRQLQDTDHPGRNQFVNAKDNEFNSAAISLLWHPPAMLCGVQINVAGIQQR